MTLAQRNRHTVSSQQTCRLELNGVVMPDTDVIEVKVNIAGDVAHALTLLGLVDGKHREIWFLDDLTDGARPPLPLLSAGVIFRLRRRDNGKGDSTVKLRPCRRSQLVPPWDVVPAGAGDYRIEGDWCGRRHVVAASAVADLERDTIARALANTAHIADAFTAAQRDFLGACADITVALGGLNAIGPIASTQWKDFSLGGVPDVVAERWTVRGLDYLELSIRVTSGTRDAVEQQRAFEDEVLVRGLTFDDSEEPKTTRVLKRLAGLD